MTFPKTVGQIPFNFPAKPNSQVDGPRKPGLDGNQSRINGALYDFGFGLSYTTFAYSNLELSDREIRPDRVVRGGVRHYQYRLPAGRRGGALYVRDCISSITIYEKTLKGFERIGLEPGEKKRVRMTLTPKDLSLLDAAMQRVVEPGEFDILVGASSTDIRLARPYPGRGAAQAQRRSHPQRRKPFPGDCRRGGEVTLRCGTTWTSAD